MKKQNPGRPCASCKNVKQDLMISAIKLFADNDFNSVSLKDIAKSCGTTSAMVHYYFGSKEKLIDYFAAKSTTIRNLVFYNLVSASLNDDWYSVEEHFLIETIQEKFQITDKKKYELMKQVYAERDLREKIKRIIQEKC